MRPEDCAICEPSQTPSVLDPIFHPKCPTLTDPPFHLRVHPIGLTCALHILQHTLKKMVTEKVIKRPQIAVNDVIEFEHFACDIVIAGNERDDYIPALLKRMARTDTGNR